MRRNPLAVSPVARLLAALDRLPGLGGGRTHAVFLALFFVSCLSLYLAVLKVRGPDATASTFTAWDRAFPFTPWWLWVYLLPYAVGPLIAAVLSRAAFAWYVGRAVVVFVVSIMIFLIYPTHTERPLQYPGNEVKLGDDVTSRMYRQIIAIDDPPSNAAPSLHVSLSCLLAWALAYDRPRWGPVAFAVALVVWFSTLYTWQHHLIDVATGVLLASVAAVGGPRKQPAAANRQSGKKSNEVLDIPPAPGV